MRQSERRRVIPTQDLTSDLNSERDFSTNNDSFVSYGNVTKSNRSSMKFDFNEKKNSKFQEDEIKTPDFDHNFIFQVNLLGCFCFNIFCCVCVEVFFLYIYSRFKSRDHTLCRLIIKKKEILFKFFI